MSLGSSSPQFAALRHHAQLLVERTRRQEDDFSALVASAERDVRHAETVLSHAGDADLDQVRKMLSAQVERIAASAATARRLCVGAHEPHAAARQLLVDLDGDQAADEEYRHAVLVVDDYSDVRELLARVLQEAGFVVRTAANGLEALIAAYQMRPGVIVMDVSMPVLDGIEATRLIKACDATRDAAVIAYTGNSPFDARLAQTLFAAVLQKPASPDVVLATVQRVAGL
jgi:CheY-like chemotaxis protein